METKEETLNPDGTWGKSYYKIVEHTKTHDKGDRLLYLIAEARELIKLTSERNKKYGYQPKYLCREKHRDQR